MGNVERERERARAREIGDQTPPTAEITLGTSSCLFIMSVSIDAIDDVETILLRGDSKKATHPCRTSRRIVVPQL